MTEEEDRRPKVVTAIQNGDFIKVQGVDLANEQNQWSKRFPHYVYHQIRTDRIDGPLIATVKVNKTGQSGLWTTFLPLSKMKMGA